ncbi:MAG: DMT family transporter [Candidatus Bathyarchaeota archaeon]|jgi:drug/metabolite transporter (DMT)-like permease
MVSREGLADVTLLGVSLIWGGTFPLIKVVLQETSPYVFLSLRFVIATLILIVIFRKEVASTRKEVLRAGFLIGVFIFIGYMTQTVGLKYTTASKSGFITGLYVVFTPVLSYMILRTTLPRKRILAVLMALTGLFLLSEIDPIGLNMNYGDFLTLVCAIAYAFSVVLIDKYTKEFSPSVLATVQAFTTCIFSMLAWAVLEPLILPTSRITWVAILITAVFATTIAFLAQNYAQKYTTATKAAIIFTAEPIFALIFSFATLGETLSQNGIIGAVLIIAGMLLSELAGREVG